MERKAIDRSDAPNYIMNMSEFTLSEDANLSQLADQLRENRDHMFMHNLLYLLTANRMNQQDFCKKIGNVISPAQLCNYKKPGRDIPFRVVCLCSIFFKIPPEDFYTKDLQSEGIMLATSSENEGMSSAADKYCGTYDIAFANTGEPVGKNNKETPDALSYGVMTIYLEMDGAGIKHNKVIAYVNCKEKDITAIRKAIKGGDFGSGVVAAYQTAAKTNNQQKYIYSGNLQLKPEIAEITLDQENGNDTVHFYFHNRAAASSIGSRYRGGLGALLSSSRGEHMPCVQAALISSSTLFGMWSEEEIEGQLRMAPIDLDIEREANDIYSYMSMMFPSEEDSKTGLASLNRDDKVECVKSFIQKKLTKPIARNYLDYFKITKQKDSSVYKLIRDKSENPRN